MTVGFALGLAAMCSTRIFMEKRCKTAQSGPMSGHIKKNHQWVFTVLKSLLMEKCAAGTSCARLWTNANRVIEVIKCNESKC